MSKLNANAKPFKFNPSAKPFNPSFDAAPAPAPAPAPAVSSVDSVLPTRIPAPEPVDDPFISEYASDIPAYQTYPDAGPMYPAYPDYYVAPLPAFIPSAAPVLSGYSPAPLPAKRIVSGVPTYDRQELYDIQSAMSQDQFKSAEELIPADLLDAVASGREIGVGHVGSKSGQGNWKHGEKSGKSHNHNANHDDDDFTAVTGGKKKKKSKGGKVQSTSKRHDQHSVMEALKAGALASAHKTPAKRRAEEEKKAAEEDLGDYQLHQSDHAWVPSAKAAATGSLPSAEDALAELSKSVTSILNKLAPEKFDRLIMQTVALNIDSVSQLDLLVQLIFDKAIDEPNFAALYAQFCAELSPHMPEFPPSGSSSANQNFRVLLLMKCYKLLNLELEEFVDEENEAAKANGKSLSELEREEKENLFRLRQKGNIVLIGELYKQDMLARNIMFACVELLLRAEEPTEMDIESLCVFLTTVGALLDRNSPEENDPKTSKGKDLMDVHFKKIRALSKSKTLQSRHRFMLMDLIELRERKWVARREMTVNPKLLKEIHEEFGLQTPKGKPALTKHQSATSASTTKKPSGKAVSFAAGPTNSASRPAAQAKVGSQDARLAGPQAGILKSSIRTAAGARTAPPLQRSQSAPEPEEDDEPERPNNLSRALDEVAADRSPSSFSASITPSVRMPESRVLSSAQKQEKQKQRPSVSFALTPSEMKRKIELLIEEYWNSNDLSEACLCLEELTGVTASKSPVTESGPLKYTDTDGVQQLVYRAVLASFELSERHRQRCSDLITGLMVRRNMSSYQLLCGLTGIIQNFDDILLDSPKAVTFFTQLLSRALADHLLSLKSVSLLLIPMRDLESADKVPDIILSSLRQLVDLKEQRWIVKLWMELHRSNAFSIFLQLFKSYNCADEAELLDKIAEQLESRSLKYLTDYLTGPELHLSSSTHSPILRPSSYSPLIGAATFSPPFLKGATNASDSAPPSFELPESPLKPAVVSRGASGKSRSLFSS